MNRALSIALIATICFTCVAKAEDKPSPAVKRILDKAVVKVRANRTEFDKANKKPLDEARAELQELAKNLVDSGKSMEAQAVLKQVDTLNADVMKMANAPAPVPVPVPRPAPQKPLLERLAGKWKYHAYPNFYRLDSSGHANVCRESDGLVEKRGTITVPSPEVAVIAWETGDRDEIRMAGDDIVALLGKSPDGKRTNIVLERIK